jgi:hypothetical protein
LAVSPGMIDFRQPVLDPTLFTDAVEQVLESQPILQAIGELNAVVRKDDMNAVGHDGHQTAEELTGRGAGLVSMQLGVSELRRAVDGDEQVEPSLLGMNLGDVHMEVADGVFSELFLRWLVAFDLRQAADDVTLQAAVEAETSQERDAGLKCVEAIVERQQRPLTEGDDDGLLLRSENSRVGLSRIHPSVFNAGTLAPFSHGLRIEVIARG